MKGIRIFSSAVALTAVLAMLWLSACGGDSVGGLDTKAGQFSGSAVANFSGPDADDSDARQEARALMVNRVYDFTETGYIIQSGLASTAAPGNVNFGNGTGLVTVTGGSGTISLGIAPASPNYSNVELYGTFSALSAQSAVDNAGNTFTVSWELTYTHDGQDYEIHFEQTLTGTDFREV